MPCLLRSFEAAYQVLEVRLESQELEDLLAFRGLEEHWGCQEEEVQLGFLELEDLPECLGLGGLQEYLNGNT